ncbi:plasmid mobilization relaxosome protein MobC [Demequina iriomotensis]|uniref:plasmid mobilization relaxosome protein MobC n=1 Tax=Demequina iriomotensis TaxID=1536641 RepID=UPI0014704AF4|nr:plasmid mobilization relaxosome protein MobC [Demequina iriomotensis]
MVDLSVSEVSDNVPARSRLDPLQAPQGPEADPVELHGAAHGAVLQAARSDRARSGRFDVRLEPGDREAIAARARAYGVKPSAWVRAVLRDALHASRHELDTLTASVTPGSGTSLPDPTVAAAVEQLRRVGQNLNQLARAAHDARRPLPVRVPEALLTETRDTVDRLRRALGDRTRL